MTLHCSEGHTGDVNPTPHKTELFTSAISAICLACGLPDLGNRGIPLHKPSLHPSCTKRIRAEVSITALTPITDLVDDPFRNRACTYCTPVLLQMGPGLPCSVVSAEPQRILPALLKLLGSEVRSCQCLLSPGC